MSPTSTWISRIVHILILLVLVPVAIGFLSGLAISIMALVDPSLLSEGTIRLNGQAVTLRDPANALPAAGIVMLVCAVAGLALWQIAGMLRSAARGMPFVYENVRRLRIIAALFAVGFVVQAGAAWLPGMFRGLVALENGRIDVGMLFSALLTIVLAEVFRAGVALREEAEGTI